MTRQKYTPEKIIENVKYRTILNLMMDYERKGTPIRRSQLIKALVQGKLEVTAPVKLTTLYQEGQITKEQYLRGKKLFEETIPKQSQFKSELGLRNAIIRLKELGMVRSVKPKFKYHYLVMTEYGLVCYLKFQINWKINLIKDPKFLLELDNNILTYFFSLVDKKNKKKK